MRAIDLNADMGEYANDAEQANEAALMPLVSSCSIACGGHAGDDETMRATIQLAKTYGVSIGAHPSYPDRDGFGRRTLEISENELFALLKKQVAALKKIADEEGAAIAHVKPHGMLYNDAASNLPLARLVAAAAEGFALVGPPGSALEDAAMQAGLHFAAEGFVDRSYQASGALTPRSQPGAIIPDAAARAAQALAIARGDMIRTAEGVLLSLAIQTLCIHSDSPGAVETAESVRKALQDAGFSIRPFS